MNWFLCLQYATILCPIYPFVWNLCLISVHISRCNSWYKPNDSKKKIISLRCSFLSRHHLQCGDLLWHHVTVLSAGTNVWYQLFLHWKNNIPFKNFKSRTGWIFRKKWGQASSFTRQPIIGMTSKIPYSCFCFCPHLILCLL